MESEAPSWADQWGAGGIGAMADDNINPNKQETKDGNKKGNAKTGLNKAAQKIKTGVSNSFKWVKAKCQWKTAPQ